MPEELCQVSPKSHYVSLALHSDPSPFELLGLLTTASGATNVLLGSSASPVDRCWVLLSKDSDGLKERSFERGQSVLEIIYYFSF